MHFHRKSAHFTCSNGIKVLLIVLVTYASSASSTSVTPEDIAEAVKEIHTVADTAPANYCGKRLTLAMKTFCIPAIKNAILRGSVSGPMSKKSCKSSVCHVVFGFVWLFDRFSPHSSWFQYRSWLWAIRPRLHLRQLRRWNIAISLWLGRRFALLEWLSVRLLIAGQPPTSTWHSRWVL